MLIPRATLVADLGFGDAGKGTVIDYLARQRPTAAVVRFNGGAQAAHNVHTTDGRHHTFAQFGAGTFVPGVRTHLSRFVLVDPPALSAEATALATLGVTDVYTRLSIDAAATVVTPFHKVGNRFREVARGSGQHGSVGRGVGETMADRIAFPHQAVTVADLRDPERLRAKFTFFQALKRQEFGAQLALFAGDAALAPEAALLLDPTAPERLAAAYWRFGQRVRIVTEQYLGKLAAHGDLLFEGAQGVLLDEWHGFHPYTTWSTTTFDNAALLLSEIGYQGEVVRLGVLRGYMTRHGPGPFPTEDRGLTTRFPDPHNTFGRWQGGFRVGWFDTVLARYAMRAARGVDGLVLTNLDRLASVPSVPIATSYDVGVVSPAEADMLIGPQEAVRSFRRKPFLSDLAYQERLTAVLGRAKIRYETVPTTPDYVSILERELGAPVVLTSYGPTAADKRVRQAGLRAAA